MKQLLLLLLLWVGLAFFCPNSQAKANQPQGAYIRQVDSLLQLVDVLPETEHPELFLKISQLAFNFNRSQSWAYAAMAKDLADSLGNKKILADALSWSGSLHSSSESPAQALYHFMNALPIYEQLEDSANMAGLFLNIGIVYGNQGQPEESASYFERARLKFKTLGNSKGEALALNNLGNLAQLSGGYDTALAYFTKSLGLFSLINETGGIVNALNNIAENKLLSGKPDAAWPFLEEASAVDSLASEKFQYLLLAARVSEAERNYQLAIQYANKALKRAESIGSTDNESEANKLLYELYKRVGKFELASIHQEAYSENLARLYKQRNDRMISNLELQNELKYQQSENRLLRKSREVKALELRRRTQLSWLTGIAFFLIGGLALILYRNLKREKVTNEKLLKLNTQIRQKNREISNTTERLLTANQELESFNFAVSHDLKTPLRSIFGFYQLLERKYKGNLDDDALDLLTQIGASAKQMQGVIGSLLDLSKVNQHEIARDMVDLGAFSEEIIQRIKSAPGPDNGIVFEARGDLYVQADQELMKILLSNLLGNAIKYAADDRPLKIELFEQNGIYCVRDNGIGFEQQYAQRIFKAFQRLHSVDEFEGSGVGLATVERVIRKHGGEVWAVSEPGKGASFYFTLGSVAKINEANSENQLSNIAGAIEKDQQAFQEGKAR